MKKSTIAATAAIVAGAAAIILIYALNPQFGNDEITNTLAKDGIVRAALTLVMAAVAALCCGKELFRAVGNVKNNLIWCLPCLAVAVANFPFYALISGGAQIVRADLLWLFLIKCLLIATSEELLFRGALLWVVRSALAEKRHRYVLSVLITSALFGLFHLFNLAAGASLPATLMQVGYSFLTGAMFASVTLKTGNIWGAIALHFIFDIGGLIVSDLGSGSPHDWFFWILTAVCTAICAVHLIIYAVRRDRQETTSAEGKDQK